MLQIASAPTCHTRGPIFNLHVKTPLDFHSATLSCLSLFCVSSSIFLLLTQCSSFLASGVLLQRNPKILKLPPYLSFLCVIIGVAWLLVLPLDDYSRKTYISENALLPGQVHTYFAGSDQNVFRGYKHEVDALEDRTNIEYATHSPLRTDRY
jgi:hypothetical protein